MWCSGVVVRWCCGVVVVINVVMSGLMRGVDKELVVRWKTVLLGRRAGVVGELNAKRCGVTNTQA